MASRSAVAWGIVFATLVAFAIPWFMWREAATVAGLPVWLWWHVGWLCLTSGAFAVFARRDWGIFVEAGAEPAGATEGER
ncbi:DUF3311 domain-containing protein [Halobacterium zhouii]|uniref:DUF3311 domain-containing protein n=1 Tax=Halobacterium zhouii TaxID=2902624 RepID=UPI001E34AC7A|nr:DUF3311 domain-containing protein [Halobacterium zhouii]